MASWSDHYRYDKYLYAHPAQTVFAARVNQSSFSYPIAQVTYDGVTTGAYTDIEIGMTVLLGSTAGASDLGRQRIRTTPTSSILYIGWSSRGVRDGELNLTDNAYITVIDDYRAWAKIPRITSNGTLYKDYDIAYGDGTPAPPVANGGGGVAQIVDGSDQITVDFDATDSFVTAPGASISSYAWDFVDGTPSGAATSTVNDVVFPAGFRWVKLTVTDSNGKTHATRMPVLAAVTSGGSKNVITQFEVASQLLTRNGQSMAFDIFQDLPEGTYYDGFTALYFETEYYNDVEAYLSGPAGRENLKFRGWHDIETESLNPSESTYAVSTSLQCLDIGGRMRQLPSFPQAVLRDASPSSWLELANANTDRYMHYLLHWHSTVLEVAPFTWSGTGDTYALPSFLSPGQNLFEQIAFRTRSIAHELAITMRGALGMRPDPQLQDPGDRTNTVITDIDPDGWLGVNYTHTRPPRFYWLWSNAVVASTSEADTSGQKISAAFCVAPGKAPGQGEGEQAQGEQIVDGQSELNAREGHRYAVRLNPFETFFEIPLTYPGDIGIDPSLMEWVRLTITSDLAARRGLYFTDERFLPFELDIVHNNNTQTKEVFLRAERERSGTPAATYIPPISRNASGSDGVFPGTADVIIPDIPGVEDWPIIYETDAKADTPNTVYAADQRYVKRTRNFLDTTPTWTTVFDAVTDVGGAYDILEYQPDNLAPKSTACVIVSDESSDVRLYRTTNLESNPPTWTLKQTWSVNCNEAYLLHSIYSGVWMALIKTASNANFYRTLDDWATIDTTVSNILGSTPNSPSFFLSNHAASVDNGLVAVSYSGGANSPQVTVSRDYGQTFSSKSYTFPDYAGPDGIHIPYNGGESEQIWYALGGNAHSAEAWVYKTTNGGAGYTDISPLYDDLVGDGTLSYGWGKEGAPFKRILYSHTRDGNKLALCGSVCNATHAFHKERLFISDDGGDTWTMQSDFGIALADLIYALGGWPYDENILFASGSAHLLYSDDRGATWSEKQWTGYVNGVWTVPIWVA